MRKELHIYYDDVNDKELMDWINNKFNWKGIRTRNSFILSVLYKYRDFENIGTASIIEQPINFNRTHSPIGSVSVRDIGTSDTVCKENPTPNKLNDRFLSTFKSL